jgi:hypothetical protein
MMAKAVSSPILQLIHGVVEEQSVRQLSDHHLLQQFSAQQDEAAFGALLRRHGAMVLDVCRSVLGNEADAEDAFQATFLIFARKAPSIRKKASVGSWLHGVAYRTAIKARVQSATRQKKEARAPARQVSEPDDVTDAQRWPGEVRREQRRLGDEPQKKPQGKPQEAPGDANPAPSTGRLLPMPRLLPGSISQGTTRLISSPANAPDGL